MHKQQPAPDIDEDIAVEGLDDETNPALPQPDASPLQSSSLPLKNKPALKRTTLKPHVRGVAQTKGIQLSGGTRGTITIMAPKELNNVRGALKMLRALFLQAVKAGDLWLAHEITQTIQSYLIGSKTGGKNAAPVDIDAMPDDAEFGGDDTPQPDAPIDDDEIEPQPDALPMSRATEQRSIEDKDKQSAAERERRDRDR